MVKIKFYNFIVLYLNAYLAYTMISNGRLMDKSAAAYEIKGLEICYTFTSQSLPLDRMELFAYSGQAFYCIVKEGDTSTDASPDRNQRWRDDASPSAFEIKHGCRLAFPFTRKCLRT